MTMKYKLLSLWLPVTLLLPWMGGCADSPPVLPADTAATQSRAPLPDPYAPISFPEEALEMRLRQALGNREGPLCPADFAEVTTLDLSMCGIRDLTPLSGLTQLTSLLLFENAITDLTPLAGLTELTVLFLNGNAITDLTPLVGLTRLTSLDLGSNAITDLTPLAELPALRNLALDQNPITDWSPVAHIEHVYGRPDEEKHHLD